jgi:hypothetical protein
MKWKSLILKTYTIHRMQKVIVKNSPFLGDEESTHYYNGRLFIVDFYPNNSGNPYHGKGSWQCIDSGNIIRARSDSGKKEVIEEAHKLWDSYVKKMAKIEEEKK